MGIMVNNIVLGGEIDGDVNFHRVNDDIPVCNFTLRHKPNDCRNPEFDVPVAVWNTAAEAARDHLRDGSQVIVEGGMTTYKGELRLKANYIHFVANCGKVGDDDFYDRDRRSAPVSYEDGYCDRSHSRDRKSVRT